MASDKERWVKAGFHPLSVPLGDSEPHAMALQILDMPSVLRNLLGVTDADVQAITKKLASGSLAQAERPRLFTSALGAMVEERIIHNTRGHSVWPHQIQACLRAKELFAGLPKGKQFCCLVLPTGTGKSGVIAMLPYILKPRSALLITPQVTIRKQLFGTFKGDIAGAAAKRKRDSGAGEKVSEQSTDDDSWLVQRGVLDKKETKMLPLCREALTTDDIADHTDVAQFDVCMINASLMGYQHGKNAEEKHFRWQKHLRPTDFDLVIFDEAHHFPASTWKSIREFFEPHAQVVFMTATPFRTDGAAVCEPKSALINVISRHDAVDRQYIRQIDPPVVVVPQHKPVELPSSQEKKKIEAPGAIFLVAETIVKTLRGKDTKSPLPGGAGHKAIAYARTKDEAGLLARSFKFAASLHNNLAGESDPLVWSAVTYHGSNKGELKGSISRFHANENCRLVVVCGKLAEGYDFPQISVSAFCSPTSMTKVFQFIGRAVRYYSPPGPPVPALPVPSVSGSSGGSAAVHAVAPVPSASPSASGSCSAPSSSVAKKKKPIQTATVIWHSELIEMARYFMLYTEDKIAASVDSSDSDHNKPSKSAAKLDEEMLANATYDMLIKGGMSVDQALLTVMSQFVKSKRGEDDDTIADLNNQLERHGLRGLDCGGGGRCLYYSIAHQLNRLAGSNAHTWNSVKTAVLQHIKAIPPAEMLEHGNMLLAYYDDDDDLASIWRPRAALSRVASCFGQLIDRIYGANDKFADQFIVAMAAKTFNLNIRVYSSRGFVTNYPAAHGNGMIEVGHICQWHYVSVIPAAHDAAAPAPAPVASVSASGSGSAASVSSDAVPEDSANEPQKKKPKHESEKVKH